MYFVTAAISSATLTVHQISKRIHVTSAPRTAGDLYPTGKYICIYICTSIMRRSQQRLCLLLSLLLVAPLGCHHSVTHSHSMLLCCGALCRPPLWWLFVFIIALTLGVFGIICSDCIWSANSWLVCTLIAACIVCIETFKIFCMLI